MNRSDVLISFLHALVQVKTRKIAIAEISRAFEKQLEVLQRPDARERLERVFEARGKARNPPVAGARITF